MMHLIIDAQLPPSLCVFFESHGHRAEHVMLIGMGNVSDSAIWDYALAHGAVIFTKDEDFQIRALAARDVPAVVWLRIGNCSRRALLLWLEPLLPMIVERLEAGEKLIEIR